MRVPPHILSRCRRASRGFSLIELLASIGIIGLLSAALFPAFSNMLEKGRGAKCESNLKQIGAGAHAFAADNDGYLPSQSSPIWTSQVWPYLYPNKPAPATMPSDKFPPEFVGTVFECPQARFDAASMARRVRDYGFNYQFGDSDADTRDRMGSLASASRVAMVGDDILTSSLAVSSIRARHGKAFNVLYVDGHVEATLPTTEITKNYNGVFWGITSASAKW